MSNTAGEQASTSAPPTAGSMEDRIVARVTSTLQNTIAVLVRKALQDTSQEFNQLAAEASSGN